MSMPSDADSSSQVPAASAAPPAPATSPASAPPVEMSLVRKNALLTSRRTILAIRKIARSRAVPKQSRQDVVQSTCTLAWKARLPENEDEARKVIHKIAFVESCRFMASSPLGEAVEYREEAGDEDGEAATPIAVPEPPVEVRDALARLAELGQEKFPTGFQSYVEGRANEESSLETAARRGVTDGHVRKEAQGIQTFLRKHGKKMGLLSAAGIALLVLSAIPFEQWKAGMRPGDFSERAAIRTRPPEADAPTLRDRAKRACADGAWQACLDDLDAADRLDPNGDTVELLSLRAEAVHEIVIVDPVEAHPTRDPREFHNVKPPLY